MCWVIGLVILGVIVISMISSDSKSKASKAPVRKKTEPPPEFRYTTSRETSRPLPSQTTRRSRHTFDIRWFGRDTELKVGNLTLKAPCVYASSGGKRGYPWATDPSEILIDAPVRRSSTPSPEMGYWPWYSRLDPEQRYEYLSWLASGRSKLPANDGYLFLYFYGIERRLLIDEADRAWGLQEVVRLRKLDEPRSGTREGRSFRSYSTGLVWFEIARTPNLFNNQAFEQAIKLTDRWTPELMSAPLAWLATKNQALPPVLARHIAAANPAAQRSVVTKRVSDEFHELFETRYRETYGNDGMALKVSKRPVWHTYRPASGGLEEMRIQVQNPMGIKSQFKKLPDIWNSCIADLRKLSRLSASIDSDEISVDAWEAMPDELRADVDHPLAATVAHILSQHTSKRDEEDAPDRNANATMIQAGYFAELIGIERRPKLTATQSRKLATTLEHTGYGIVPDARIAPVRYGWDELVAVVPGLDDDDVDTSRYNAASCVLRLGLSIALADGEADEMELRVLTDHIDAVFDLSPEEQQRIAALRDLLLTTGSDIRPIARKIQEMLTSDARQKVGRLLVVIAAATNGIDRNERAALRKAFRALDLAPELLEETIAEVTPEADEREVSVKPAKPGSRIGEAISAMGSSSEFTLNHAAINTIMAETRQVSVMLAEAMGAIDPAEDTDELDEGSQSDEMGAAPITQALAENKASLIAGPGGRYEALFIAMIAQDRWDRNEADLIARSHGLMLDAGIETINDWAFDALGVPLIEDVGDQLFVDRSLLNEDV